MPGGFFAKKSGLAKEFGKAWRRQKGAIRKIDGGERRKLK
jgi:hypothetical protein